MAVKSFRGYMPTDVETISIENADGSRSVSIRLAPSVPGSVVLDFMRQAKSEEPGTLADAVMRALQAAVEPDDWTAFREFIDKPENGITVNTLAEIAGYAIEKMSGDRPTGPSPVSSTI
jgi:hypothetical protein